MFREVELSSCFTYCPLPYSGQGPAQSCVSLLENFQADFHRTLALPRARRPVGSSVDVRQTLPLLLRYLPWRAIGELGRSSLNHYFYNAISAADPRNSIAYFWPTPPLPLVQRARDRGFLTVREMTNTFRGTAKRILDPAYEQLGLAPDHGISKESVDQEREELAAYDYVFASNPLVEASLIEAEINPSRILSSSYGWSPSRFSANPNTSAKGHFRTLFVGSVGVGKGVPQLLAAWKKSGVQGELVLAGRVEEAIRPLLKTYLDNDSIRLLGFVSDVGRLFQSADIFVFPTLTEGGPQVTYEASGCGLPIITTPMGAGRIVKDGVNGLIVAPNDVDGLAKALSRLASSRELRDRLARQASIDARQYTYEKIGLERSNTMKSLLDRRMHSGG